jgi:hypothetical protein
MRKRRRQKYRPIIDAVPQSLGSIRGRGASWSPANRFEKLHVDLTDVDVVDADPDNEEKPGRSTQYFRDATKRSRPNGMTHSIRPWTRASETI